MGGCAGWGGVSSECEAGVPVMVFPPSSLELGSGLSPTAATSYAKVLLPSCLNKLLPFLNLHFPSGICLPGINFLAPLPFLPSISTLPQGIPGLSLKSASSLLLPPVTWHRFSTPEAAKGTQLGTGTGDFRLPRRAL